MSGPVTNAEIEDVLSSIRRLVSENSGGLKRDEVATPVAERLVLTPDFRVDGGAEDAFDDAEDELETDEPDMDVELTPDFAHPTDSEVPEVEEAPVSGESRESDLAARIAGLEAAIARSNGDYEPDGSEEAAAPETVLFRHIVPEEEAVAESVLEAEVVSEEEVASEGSAAEPQPDSEAWAPMLEDVFEPEAAPETLHFEGYDEAEIVDVEDVELVDEDDAILDEDMLREFVVRMIREELQGKVGERITTNVRRLVRREISRALSLREIE